MTFIKPYLALVLGSTSLLSSSLLAADDQEHWNFLDTYCMQCHNTEDWSGDLAFDILDQDSLSNDAIVWEEVIRKLNGRMMPPSGEEQPPAHDIKRFVAELESNLDGVELHPAFVKKALHRLNRTEYANAIEDILGLQVDPENLLPKEVESEGFDNIAEVLKISPAFLDQYITAADVLTTQAVGNPNAGTDAAVYRIPDGMNQNLFVDGLPFGTRGGMVVDHYFPSKGDYEFNIKGLAISTYISGLDYADTVIITIDGEEIFSGDLGGDPDLRIADQDLEQGVAEVNGRFQKIRRTVSSGPHKVGVTFIARSLAESDEILHSFIPSQGLPRQAEVGSLDITGPFNPQGHGNTPSRQQIFTCTPQVLTEEQACAEQILSNVARRAFRRPVSQNDLRSPLQFYAAARETGTFDNGIQQGLFSILSSPKFLYRAEFPPLQSTPDSMFRVSDLELASKLSFFLWSRQPDDELLNVAEANKLHEPKVLEEQVRRMLADPKAQSLVTNFAFQWLNINSLELVIPDAIVYPEYDRNLRDAFEQEMALFIGSIFENNRSVIDLLTAKNTFVNERLAQHYGIKSVRGEQFQEVILEDSTRWGILGKGSLLMVTSYANRTSPVVRGAYILERIIGSPPPSPPPDVEAFPENLEGMAALTVRERLGEHRANPACSSCHNVMDPLGLALENFDALGQWRDIDRESGSPINATGRLVNGTPISGVDDLRNALSSEPKIFAQVFTEKLMTYALGRSVQYYDMPTVRAIVREAAKDDYAFSSIVLNIINSDTFQMQYFAGEESIEIAEAH